MAGRRITRWIRVARELNRLGDDGWELVQPPRSTSDRCEKTTSDGLQREKKPAREAEHRPYESSPAHAEHLLILIVSDGCGSRTRFSTTRPQPRNARFASLTALRLTTLESVGSGVRLAEGRWGKIRGGTERGERAKSGRSGIVRPPVTSRGRARNHRCFSSSREDARDVNFTGCFRRRECIRCRNICTG